MEGLRRYGFHGLSYEYVAAVLPDLAPTLAAGRVIVAHLGDGASLCALQRRLQVNTTLGFRLSTASAWARAPGRSTPVSCCTSSRGWGSTRPRSRTSIWRSGLLGLSEIASDMRVLLASDDPRARLAVDYFVFRAAKEIGALAASLGGLDALVFTAAVGERLPGDPPADRPGLGVAGDRPGSRANARGGPLLSRPDSRVSVFCLPTDEERIIARHTQRLVGH